MHPLTKIYRTARQVYIATSLEKYAYLVQRKENVFNTEGTEYVRTDSRRGVARFIYFTADEVENKTSVSFPPSYHPTGLCLW